MIEHSQSQAGQMNFPQRKGRNWHPVKWCLFCGPEPCGYYPKSFQQEAGNMRSGPFSCGPPFVHCSPQGGTYYWCFGATDRKRLFFFSRLLALNLKTGTVAYFSPSFQKLQSIEHVQVLGQGMQSEILPSILFLQYGDKGFATILTYFRFLQ